MTRIWLIRHAEAEGNLFRRIHGVYDAPLTELGRRQLERLRERFAAVPLDAVYASDLSRAVETAGALAGPKGLTVRPLPALREVNMGAWEDRTWGWAARFDPAQYRAQNRDPERFTVPGCERYDAALRRILGAVRAMAAAHPGGDVAAVTHGSILRILLAHLLGYAADDIWSLPHGDNTAVAELAVEEGGIAVLRYNDNAHLPPELSAFSREDWWKNEDGKDGRDLCFLPMDVASEAGGRSYLRRYRETWIASYGTDLGFSDVYLSRARAHAAEDPQTVTEVFAESVPCGMLELSPQKGAEVGAGHITLLFLEKDYRGRGLGVQLIGQAVSYYRRLGRRFLRLQVAEPNDTAVEFYKRWGFTVAGTEPGTFGDTFVMVRPL